MFKVGENQDKIRWWMIYVWNLNN